MDQGLDHLKSLRADEKEILVSWLNKYSDFYAAELVKTMRPITLFFPPKSTQVEERQLGEENRE